MCIKRSIHLYGHNWAGIRTRMLARSWLRSTRVTSFGPAHAIDRVATPPGEPRAAAPGIGDTEALVRIVDRRRGPRFLLEALQAFGVGRRGRARSL